MYRRATGNGSLSAQHRESEGFPTIVVGRGVLGAEADPLISFTVVSAKEAREQVTDLSGKRYGEVHWRVKSSVIASCRPAGQRRGGPLEVAGTGVLRVR
jgi:hypothetical protein